MSKLKEFESKDFVEQVSILSALAQEKDYACIPDIIPLMDKFSRHDAIGMVLRDTMKSLLSGSEEQTIRLLSSDNREVQQTSIEVAGQKKFASAAGPLMGMAEQAYLKKEYGVLFTLITALSRIQPPEALDLFRKCRDHEDSLISSQCIDMLGVMQDTSSFDSLCDMITGEDIGDVDGGCDLPTASAIRALGRFKTPEAIEFLISNLHHESPTVRRLIHEELAAIGAESVGPLSSVFQKGTVDEKIFAANILGIIGSKEAGDVLVKAVDKGLAKDPNISFAIYDALGRTPGMKSLVCLVDALEEMDQMVLMAVVSSLGLHLNQWILDKIAEMIRKDAARSAMLVKSIISSRSSNIFEGLYLADEKIAEQLVREIGKSGDSELVSQYCETLSAMDTDRARSDMKALEGSTGKSERAHILAVDDSKAMLNFYRSVASSMGVSISTAMNGKEALDALSGGEDFRLIITDMNMPVMDGIEFTKQVRGGLLFSDIPIIMITTESDRSQENLAKKSGVDSFLHKPFSTDKLQETIRSYIDAKI